MKKFSLIAEKAEQKFEYGICMTEFKHSKWKDILSEIKKEDISTDPNCAGLEENPHITILYGLHEDVDFDEVCSIFENINKITVNITDISLFENDKFDVIKFDIESNELNILHEWLKYSFDYTSDYPDYKAHATIAYVESGKGKNYCDLLKDKYLKESEQTIDTVIVSFNDFEKKIKLN